MTRKPRGPYRIAPGGAPSVQGLKLRQERFRRGHTQAQAAEFMGVARSRIAQWETGARGAPSTYWSNPEGKALARYLAGEQKLPLD